MARRRLPDPLEAESLEAHRLACEVVTERGPVAVRLVEPEADAAFTYRVEPAPALLFHDRMLTLSARIRALRAER